MLSLFRGKHGQTFVALFLGLVLVAMIATGVGTQSGGLSGIGSLLGAKADAVATVGSQSISMSDVSQRIDAIVAQQRQQQPDMTTQTLAASGAIPQIVDAMIGERAIEGFGDSHGMRVSKRQIDAELAQIQSLQGVDGKFDYNRFKQVLAERHLTEQQARDDIARDMMKANILVPLSGAAIMPKSIVAAYAALQVEVREGRVAQIPSQLMTNVAQPTEAQINAFYTHNLRLYSLPERRVIEYAVFSKAGFADKAKPTEAQVAANYAANKDKYAAKDLRTLTQVIVPDEAKAKALAEKAKGGASLKDAAKALGFEAITLANQDKTSYAALASPEVAAAVFATRRGEVAAPAKSPLGWHVVRVDSVSHDAGKTLDEARAEITKTMTDAKIEDVFAAFENQVQDRASAGASFAQIVAMGNGQIQTTPAILSNGMASDQPGYQPSPDLAAVVKDAFKPDSKVNSEPLIVPYGKTKDQVALYHVKAVVPSGPLPLAKVHDQVAHDALLDAQSTAAKLMAQAIVDKVNKGTELAAAVSGAGVKLPPLDMVRESILHLRQSGKPVPPPIREMFISPLHRAKLVEAQGKQGWYVIWLDKKTPVDISQQPQFVAQMQQQVGANYGQEIASEFAHAAGAELGSKKYPNNIQALTNSLLGNSGQ